MSMPRRPDVPCSVCGHMMWRGTGSLSEGRATCQPCRRKAAGRAPDERQPQWIKKPKRTAWCETCGTEYLTAKDNQRYCSPTCRPKTYGTYVGTTTTTKRGYGRAHRKLRAQYQADMNDGQDYYCWRCGIWLDPNQPWDLGHDDHDRGVYRGPECVPCNRATAATRGNRARERPEIQRTCPCGVEFTTIYPRQVYCSKRCRRARRR